MLTEVKEKSTTEQTAKARQRDWKPIRWPRFAFVPFLLRLSTVQKKQIWAGKHRKGRKKHQDGRTPVARTVGRGQVPGLNLAVYHINERLCSTEPGDNNQSRAMQMRLHSRPLPAVLIIPQRVTSWPVLLLPALIMFHVAFHGICHAQERKLLPGLLLISLKVSCWLITTSGHHPLGQAGVLSVTMTVLCWSHVTSKVFVQLTGLFTHCLNCFLEVRTVCLGINHRKAKKKKSLAMLCWLFPSLSDWQLSVKMS